MQSKDTLQLEMLQMMLKRMLILCTRIYKNQIDLNKLDCPNTNILREFNYLVETHFKTKRTVNEYAELLFKSPKTLSNVFKTLGRKTPLEFIQEWVLLETKRLLTYTNKTISDVAFEVGYDDVQLFSRFFKKK
jgi:AraC family transcriptional activator of pobA